MEVGENFVHQLGRETVQALPRALHDEGGLTAGQRVQKDDLGDLRLSKIITVVAGEGMTGGRLPSATPAQTTLSNIVSHSSETSNPRKKREH